MDGCINDKWKKIKNYEKFFKDLGEVKGEYGGKKGILKTLISKPVIESMANVLLDGGQVEYVGWSHDIDYDAYGGLDEWIFEFLVNGERMAFRVNTFGVYYCFWAVFSYYICAEIEDDGTIIQHIKLK